MTKLAPDIDEFTLLCERCGYVVEGLATDGVCPECGTPIAESLPERRVGTPWQQQRSPGSLLRTWWMTLRHPWATLDIMRFDRRASVGVILRNLLVAFTLSWIGAMILGLRENTALTDIPAMAVVVFLGCAVITAIFAGLITIEAAGLRFLGRRHGFRITKSVSTVICWHGSVGWVVVGLAVGMAFAALEASELALILAAVTALAGFLFFEWFAWLGLRRCKYANRARPRTEPPESPAPNPADPGPVPSPHGPTEPDPSDRHRR